MISIRLRIIEIQRALSTTQAGIIECWVSVDALEVIFKVLSATARGIRAIQVGIIETWTGVLKTQAGIIEAWAGV